MAAFKRKNQRKKAKERLERARIRTLEGYDQSDDSILISLPEERTNADTFVETAAAAARWLLCFVIFLFFFAGVVSVVVPESREILVGILRDSVRNLAELTGL